MFSIWIGGQPPQKEWDVMIHNRRHGLTLIAEKNWVNAEKFIPLSEVLAEAKKDPRVAKLLAVKDCVRNVSEVLRVWWLMKNPKEVYADSDCMVFDPIAPGPMIQLPSAQASIEYTASLHCVPLAMDTVKNSAGEFVEVYLIAGNGNSEVFSQWLTLWAEKYPIPGGIMETVCYEPFQVEVITPNKFLHRSTRGQHYQKEI